MPKPLCYQHILFLSTLLLGTLSNTSYGQLLISEFLASNDQILSDENGAFSDWIEIHNPTNESVQLEDWSLTDDEEDLTKWRFPALQIEGGSYLIVFASDKDRSEPDFELHTNFKISAGGEYLALVTPDGVTIATEFASEFPAQETDISFGFANNDPTSALGYFTTPTPGEHNGGLDEIKLPNQISFSETSRTFTDEFPLSLLTESSDATIYYSIDGSEPGPASQVYSGPISIADTRTIRARAVETSGILGPISSARFIKLSEDLTHRRSNLPQIVLDSQGQTLDGVFRQDGYFLLFDKNEDGVSDLSSAPSLTTRQGIRYRGSSSERFLKKPFSVEFWDEQNEDVDHSVLGMPADSDWVLYAPYRFDRTFTRNALMYELSRRIGRYAPRTRFVEVFLSPAGGDLSESHRLGVYSIIEKIKLNDERVGFNEVEPTDVPPEGPVDLSATGPWTGGYLLKVDRVDDDEFRWQSNADVTVVLTDPKLPDLDGSPYTDSDEALASSGQAQYIFSYFLAFEDRLQSDRASGFADSTYTDLIDRNSFVDHLLLVTFSKNTDGLRLSTFMHKDRDSKLVAGPIWDYDRSLDSYDRRDNVAETWAQQDPPNYFTYAWWGSLTMDPDFEQKFYDRWAQFREGPFSDGNLTSLVNEMRDEIANSSNGAGSAAQRDAAIWPSSRPVGNSYALENEQMLSWMLTRANWMDRRALDSSLLPPPPRFQISKKELVFASEGEVYYTVDGSDPRGRAGVIRGTHYGQPISLENLPAVRARTFLNGQWSTPFENDFSDGPESFEEWRKQHFDQAELDNLAISGPEATPFDGAVSNIMRYALKIPINEYAPTLLPNLDNTEGRLDFQFRLSGRAEDPRSVR